MLLRTDPFRAWDRLPSNLGAMGFEGAPAGALSAAMDAYRLGDVITVQFDLPGVDPESIDLQIERGELRLHAERRHNVPEGAQFLVRERTDTRITRRLMLGETLDVEHVDAEYHDGILTLRIPLRESAKPRRVEVRRSERSADQRAITVESS